MIDTGKFDFRSSWVGEIFFLYNLKTPIKRRHIACLQDDLWAFTMEDERFLSVWEKKKKFEKNIWSHSGRVQMEVKD